MELHTRYRGCLLGLAAGDALGTTLEFQRPGTFAPISDMVGGGPFRLLPGQWTDDTSMALCLAESLLVNRGHNAVHQLETYIRWYRKGHLSSNGFCFDIGNTVRGALHTFEDSPCEYPGPTHADSAGNGSLMRLAAVPMLWRNHPSEAIFYAGHSSRTTHGAFECVDACRFYSALIVAAFQGLEKKELLSNRFGPWVAAMKKTPTAPRIAMIAAGSYQFAEPPEIAGTGYVVKSLEAALWAFHKTDNFRDGALLAVNLGDDADTTGAIYGQLAGAFYGEEEIPAAWRAKLAHREMLEGFADKLYEQSATIVGNPTAS
jgi:ADP-ribosyl-[dinitrogen reductase] hydrolase